MEQLGDDMSRGAFDTVRKTLEGRGFEEIVHWDLGGEQEGLIPDILELRGHLFKLSKEHEAMKSAEHVLPPRWGKASRRQRRSTSAVHPADRSSGETK